MQTTAYNNIPFINDTIESKIRNLFKRKNINVRIYRQSNKLFNYFKPKRETNLCCRNVNCLISNEGKCFKKNAVYNLECKSCKKEYIGHTQRHLHTRIKEHQTRRSSDVHSYFSTCSNNEFSVKILSKLRDCVDAKISESIFIKSKKPALNNREEMLQLL